MITLEEIKRTDPGILSDMAIHYSQPKGFVGRNICYRISFNGVVYGHIVGGSCTMHLPGRDNFFGMNFNNKEYMLDKVINNIFFHVEPKNGEYPVRNFSQKCLKLFRETIAPRWLKKYESIPVGFESLVELPRSGEVYKRDGWIETGVTKGETCKRTGGKGSDSWGGARVWNKIDLRPKRVFVRRI